MNDSGKKKNSLMATWDESDSEKSKNSNKEQANIWLMADVDEKVEVKPYYES